MTRHGGASGESRRQEPEVGSQKRNSDEVKVTRPGRQAVATADP